MSAGSASRDELIVRLSRGPLPTDEWPEWTVSRNALKQRISQFRAAGFNIETKFAGQGNASYVLDEPVPCPTCCQAVPRD